jgi:hypothetical protein
MSKKTSKAKHISNRDVIRLFNWLNLTLPQELRLPKMVDVASLTAVKRSFNELHEKLARLNARLQQRQDHVPATGPDEKALAAIATNAWRAKVKIVDADTGEAKEEMRRVYRHIEAIFESLKGIGVETIDPTGRAYDSGMALKVVSFEQTPGLSKEEIRETIKPSVSWQGRLIQMGEVIVGTPPKATVSERGTDEQSNH